MPMITRLFPWLKPKTQTGLLAIHASADDLSHAELIWRNGRPMLAACVFRAGEAASEKSWSRFGNAPLPASLVLAPGDYQILPIDAPPVPPQEMKMAVRWRIKDLIDFPVDDATVDVIRLDTGQADTGGKLLAVVAHNRVLKRHIELAERTRLKLTAIDIPELAQRNIAALLETPDRVLALLSFTPQGGLLTLTRNGALCFYRRIEFSGQALAGLDQERMRPAFDRLALELQRSLDHIERQHGDWRLDKIVLALPAAVPGLADYLREQLYLPLEAADLDGVFDGDLPDPSTLAACWFALGGALRREEKAL
ncbi:MAG: agglutinin biogenesis protein MshI [Thiobacillus sp.]|nr:agglutinin biogenesis protein MshI [Thiobacillus sp.]